LALAHLESSTAHDIYVELREPSATDLHHDVVQRWKRATKRDQLARVHCVTAVPRVAAITVKRS
jgi:hypothetical protein